MQKERLEFFGKTVQTGKNLEYRKTWNCREAEKYHHNQELRELIEGNSHITHV